MKKISVAIVCVAILLVCSIYASITIHNRIINKNEREKLLDEAYIMVSNSIEDKEISIYESALNSEDIIGILKIPVINVEAPIKEGTSQKIMNTCIGHFSESDLWNGNVAFASHNGGTSAHYFEKINKLKQGDDISYITKLGIKNYKVTEVKKIKSTDWSDVYKTKNEKNTITLITCINGMSGYRLCVRGIEI